MRTLFGLLLGIVAALAVQATIGALSEMLYPSSPVDPWNRQQMAQAFIERPTGGLLLYVLSYFAGALAGGWIARLVSRIDWTAWAPAGLLGLMGLVIAISYPEPAWAQFGAFLAALIGGLVARHLPLPGSASAPGPADG